MQILVGTDPETGLNLYRELDYFIGGVKEPKITVFYRQWLQTNTGAKLREENARKYIIIDIQEISREGDPVLVSEAVFDQENNIITPAVYEPGARVIITPANIQYTKWKEKLITAEMVGAKLGDDIIIGAINSTLQSLPFNVIDNHIITGE